MRIITIASICYATNAWAAPNAKELAKEAVRLEQLADQEAEPAKKHELRKQACDSWSAAYDAGQRIEYQLSVGACKRELPDLDGAEVAFKSFLAQAPSNHKDRPLAEQALSQIVEQRQTNNIEASPPALTLTGPIPIQESPKQWKRRVIFAGGTLAGLGLIGGAIAFGVSRSQDEFSRGTITAVEQ